MLRQALVLLLVPAMTLAGQRCHDCAPEDTTRRTHILPAIGAHFGEPQKASLSLGVVLGEDWQAEGRDHARNIGLLAEPGLAGGRASLVYLRHGYGNFGSGFGVAATVLRTWDDPWTAHPNVTYAGGELILWPIVFIGPRIGLFRSIAGNPTDKRWLVSLDFGIGL